METSRILAPRSTGAANRVIAGVAGSMGERTGLEPDLIRAAFVVLTFAGGVGIPLYGVAWLLTRDRTAGPLRRLTSQEKVGLAIIFPGALLVLRSTGLWFGDRVVVPVALVAFGFAAVAVRRFGEDNDWLARVTRDDASGHRSRIIVGAVLVVGGVTAVLGSIDAIQQAGLVALAMAITAVGLFLVLGPWFFRLVDDLARERRERIRADERAEVAAHLHDSVLQTLALIQRTDDPRRMATLARAQERELRSWLYGAGDSPGRLHAGLRDQAAKIEADHDVPVDVVIVGDDADLDERTAALLAAAGEAMTNAAKHSGADRVSVYLEIGADGIETFVTDHGVGFTPEAVTGAGRGIADSIVGRLARVGGGAEITSRTGEGTEVRLWL